MTLNLKDAKALEDLRRRNPELYARIRATLDAGGPEIVEPPPVSTRAPRHDDAPLNLEIEDEPDREERHARRALGEDESPSPRARLPRALIAACLVVAALLLLVGLLGLASLHAARRAPAVQPTPATTPAAQSTPAPKARRAARPHASLQSAPRAGRAASAGELIAELERRVTTLEERADRSDVRVARVESATARLETAATYSARLAVALKGDTR